MIYGVKLTQRDIRDLATQLGWSGNPLGYEWLKYREEHPYTRIAYAKNNYGITHELFYIKDTHEFVLV